MKQKRLLTFILAVVITLCSTVVFAQEGEILVNVEIQPVLTSFNLTDNADLLLNSNGDTKETRVISSEITITSNMNAPIKVIAKEIVPDATAETQMILVSPDKYTDWENTGRSIAEKEVAIGIEVTSGFERNIANSKIWSTDIVGDPMEIGEIDARESGTFKMDAFFGAVTKPIFTKFKAIIRIEIA